MEEWRLEHVKYCNTCKNYRFPNPINHDMNRPCPECGGTWTDLLIPYYEYSIIDKATNENKDEIKRVIKLKREDPVQYELLMNTFRQKVRDQEQTDSMVKCPNCGSTQVQLVAKKWSILTGFFTNKVNRVCVNCKTKF